jgi:iron complex transport system ATP-binding protein
VHHDPDTAALRFERVTLVRGDATVLHDVDWRVDRSDRWVVLGPNGAGKTSIMALCTGSLHPTRGTVTVLGGQLGRIDVRHLRERIGMTSALIAQQLRPTLPAVDVVMTAKYGALEPWWHDYDDADRARARALLADAGFGYTADREFGVLSEGERKQVLLARAQMHEPDLLLLDEPMAGVDLGGRESLVRRLDEIGRDSTAPPIVFVTHHVEEIPPSFDRALLLRDGRVVAAGTFRDVLTSSALSETFGVKLELREDGGRFSVR